MLGALLLTVAAFVGQEPPAVEPPPAPPSAAELAQRVARVLARQAEPDAGQVAAGAAEILALGDVSAALFEALGTGRAPAPDGEDEPGARLGRGQMAMLSSAVAGLAAAQRDDFVAAVVRDPVSATRATAGLRVLALARMPDARAMLALGRSAEAAGVAPGIEDAFDEALPLAFARDAHGLDALDAAWHELGPVIASMTVKVLEELRTPEALARLRSLLGRRGEYDACLLVAIGNSLDRLPTSQVEAMAVDFAGYLDAHDSAQAQAAAAGLGRLGCPSSVPALIERLGADDAPLVHAVLVALRAISGVSMPASVNVWRSWYAREDAWWQERAPALIEALDRDDAADDHAERAEGDAEDPTAGEGPASAERDAAELVALARELTEHPLHRVELVATFTPLLADPDPVTRVLACEALERLDSRRALIALVPLLADRDPDVVAAAHSALVHVARTDLPAKLAPWVSFLRANGLVSADEPIRPRRPSN